AGNAIDKKNLDPKKIENKPKINIIMADAGNAIDKKNLDPKKIENKLLMRFVIQGIGIPK
ncbi:MAG: hypothetical protein AAB267_08885, partial [Candidatus Desantisbacteria bacterium]